MDSKNKLHDIKCNLGISIKTTSRLLSLNSNKEVFSIIDGNNPSSPEVRDRINWLWQASQLWKEHYKPDYFRLRLDFLEIPLSDGQTLYSILKQQPNHDNLLTAFSELREFGTKYAFLIKNRRSRLSHDDLNSKQNKRIQPTFGRIISFD